MTRIENSLIIRCDPAALYDYVTRPWRWHEWHPTSKSATQSPGALQPGDTYSEVIELQPFGRLPLRIRRELQYAVLTATPHREWAVRATSRGSVLHIRYRFEPVEQGVRFTRTLSYEIRGVLALLSPLLDRQNRRISVRALENLARRMESARDTQAAAA